MLHCKSALSGALRRAQRATREAAALADAKLSSKSNANRMIYVAVIMM